MSLPPLCRDNSGKRVDNRAPCGKLAGVYSSDDSSTCHSKVSYASGNAACQRPIALPCGALFYAPRTSIPEFDRAKKHHRVWRRVRLTGRNCPIFGTRDPQGRWPRGRRRASMGSGRLGRGSPCHLEVTTRSPVMFARIPSADSIWRCLRSPKRRFGSTRRSCAAG
jgi:hypothetical protein